MNQRNQTGDVMTKNLDANLIAQELGRISPLVSYAVARSEDLEGTQSFLFAVKRLLTTDEMISICRDMAAVIRREIPERPDGWAALIFADQFVGPVMGWYHVGWAGRADEWQLREGQERKAKDHDDWLAFGSRLQAVAATFGVEGKPDEGGDFSLSDHEWGGEKGPLTHTLFVNHPEFLTKELIAAIQAVLRVGRANEVVTIFPAFGEPFMTLWEGLEIRAESVVERWDRQEAEELLGDRLRIPRYARDDS
jgi:hypothetical protein